MAEGQPGNLAFSWKEQPTRSVSREKREPQTGPASGLSNTASKSSTASGEGVLLPASNTQSPVFGKGEKDLPGSKSVASDQGSTRNEGGPGSTCRTNYEGQAGREAPAQSSASWPPGVGLVHSNQPQGASPEVGEGANKSTQSAQATRTVRTTEQDWQTSLGAQTTCQAEEPGAGKPPAGICAGGAGQPASLPRQVIPQLQKENYGHSHESKL